MSTIQETITTLQDAQVGLNTAISDALAPVAAAKAALITAQQALVTAQHNLDALNGPILVADGALQANRREILRLQAELDFRTRTA